MRRQLTQDVKKKKVARAVTETGLVRREQRGEIGSSVVGPLDRARLVGRRRHTHVAAGDEFGACSSKQKGTIRNMFALTEHRFCRGDEVKRGGGNFLLGRPEVRKAEGGQ